MVFNYLCIQQQPQLQFISQNNSLMEEHAIQRKIYKDKQSQQQDQILVQVLKQLKNQPYKGLKQYQPVVMKRKGKQQNKNQMKQNNNHLNLSNLMFLIYLQFVCLQMNLNQSIKNQIFQQIMRVQLEKYKENKLRTDSNQYLQQIIQVIFYQQIYFQIYQKKLKILELLMSLQVPIIFLIQISMIFFSKKRPIIPQRLMLKLNQLIFFLLNNFKGLLIKKTQKLKLFLYTLELQELMLQIKSVQKYQLIQSLFQFILFSCQFLSLLIKELKLLFIVVWKISRSQKEVNTIRIVKLKNHLKIAMMRKLLKNYGRFLLNQLNLVLFVLKQCFRRGKAPIKCNLQGKIIIITGSNTGIGFESAKQLAEQGAQIILACRDEKKGKNTEIQINQIYKNQSEFIKLDLSDLSQIRLFVNEFKQKYNRLDVLLNNAGIEAGKYKKLTKDGFEMAFGTNHLGHFLLANLLLDILKKTENSRIVNVSSGIHKNGFPFYTKIDFEDLNYEQKPYVGIKAFSQSKLANVIFTKQLQRIFDQENLKIKAVCLNPGAVRTGSLTKGENKLLIKIIICLYYPFYFLGFKSPQKGAWTSVYCCVENFDKLKGGGYYENCQISKASEDSCNEEAGSKLWDLSAKMVNL
ncbi:short chain dehydrogenase reductase family protein, putative [Ichthyophthirius multifiliis]|uniref:Short chain dehydrogenase reductase family protein, putative n=1 Tax=Ichthyophthirius multifiliis TaxID=5932 RepID=G0QS40_ICHMU|nr:short chain dehydrogenase reductase family protein, putative [Ichthyophthirius multifiliis]EGR31982.1 short chain dehydrogenase reductase family protein, putative [Ichthyophthirius multifiliis]|eukprot:XP_004035468.1 short chain dehydrogenase reductase family protein, putative [Ichthyophthirius multifiliis]